MSEETHRALKVRAANHGQIVAAEVREILKPVVRPAGRVKLGSLLAEIGRGAGLTEEDCALFSELGDKTPVELLGFDTNIIFEAQGLSRGD